MDNQLVVLATTATDAGRYHTEAVNELTGETVTSPAIYVSITGKCCSCNGPDKNRFGMVQIQKLSSYSN